MPGRPDDSVAASVDALYALVGIEPPTLRRSDVAARSGIDPEQTLRWWRAMGFAEVADDELAFSEADVEVVLRLRTLLEDEAIADGDILRLARLMGASFSRLVEAQLAVISGDLMREHDGITTIAPTSRRVLGDGSEHDIVDFVENTMNYVWRRHLLAALAQSLHTDETDALQAVGFADLSGFSRVSKSASQQQITEIVETFETAAFDVVAAHEGRVVKLIGDEVMFVSSTFDGAVGIAIDLIERLAPIESMPPVHCGIAAGQTVRVGGDVFGPTVNLASRLTGVARPGSIAVPRAQGQHLLDRGDLDVRWVRRYYDLKGVGRTRVITIRPLGGQGQE